jgi:aryl-alcohol dehydrogenase-like predicted oxidoreductase
MADTLIPFNGSLLNRIGFGCWQLAGDYEMNGRPNGYGAIDLKESVRAIHVALEHGINFFDTAAGYGMGASETVLGAALQSARYSASAAPVICTKFAAVPGSNDATADYSAKNLVDNVDASRQRLNRESIDILLMHNPPDAFDFSAYDPTPYEKLVAEGKIGAFGVSVRTQKGAANVLQSGFGSVLEAVYNPLDRRFEDYFSNSLFKDKYLFISRVPLASGFISRRTLQQDPIFAANDIRHNFSSEQVAWVSNAVRQLSFLNDLEGGIVVSALRFQLSNNYNTISIPGIRNAVQVQDAVLAMRLGPLPADVINAITNAVPQVFYRWR